MDKKEMVNHPEHYTKNGLEAIDIIDAMDMSYDFCIGNVIKYIYRAGKKDKEKEIEDLNKAKWYLDRAIKTLESKRGK